MLDQMSKEELEALKSKASEDMQELKLKIKDKAQALNRNSNKVQILKVLVDDIEVSLKKTLAQIERNSDAEKKDPSLQQQEGWLNTVAKLIDTKGQIQQQYTEAQEKYKEHLIEEGMCIQELRQYHSQHEKKRTQYLKLSICLAQKEVESDDSVSEEGADRITEDIKTSFLRMRFS
jgi:hypothetical protein